MLRMRNPCFSVILFTRRRSTVKRSPAGLSFGTSSAAHDQDEVGLTYTMPHDSRSATNFFRSSRCSCELFLSLTRTGRLCRARSILKGLMSAGDPAESMVQKIDNLLLISKRISSCFCVGSLLYLRSISLACVATHLPEIPLDWPAKCTR